MNQLGHRINEALAAHIVISESEFTISASVGVARYPENADNIDDLLKLADMAMYKAKQSISTNQYLISDELNDKLAARKKMEQLLQTINVDQDLFLEYQPIFDCQTGELTSMEALVRWNHDTEGIIYPNDFIYVAEEIDLIKDITKWVFIEGLKQIKQWNEKYHTHYKVSLNVSDACIHNKIFFGNVEYMLETFGVKAEWLIIELTEHSLSVSPEYMKQLLYTINQTGIDISIDKFGTDPIIISDLNEFKVKEIKIDHKFIKQLYQEEDRCVVKAMIMLAEGLGIEATAKGVEDSKQYSILKSFDCHQVQGFYFDRPLSNIDFEQKYLQNK